MMETLSYGEEDLEEEVLIERQNQILTDGEYKEDSIQGMYEDWKNNFKPGALALKEKFPEVLEEDSYPVEEEAFWEYMKTGEETGQYQPFAAAAVTARENDLSEELYEEAVYRLGKNTTGMERKTVVEETYGIEVDEIRDILSTKRKEEKTYPGKRPEPAY